MDDERIRTYLARWLMEFGSGYTTVSDRRRSPWWRKETMDAYSRGIDKYFDYDGRGHKYKINEKGLDLIRGDHD